MLLKVRRECVLMRKIIDPALIEPDLRWLVFDSDVLFFRRPDELISAGNSVRPLEHCIYLRDFVSVYSIAPAIVRQAFATPRRSVCPYRNGRRSSLLYAS